MLSGILKLYIKEFQSELISIGVKAHVKKCIRGKGIRLVEIFLKSPF